MKILIYIVPGILTDINLSGFVALENKSDYIFDVKVHDIYGKINEESDIKSIVSFFEKTINKLAGTYNSICLISHSSGSEIILRSKLNKNVKSLILWSPSIFYPQTVTQSLKTLKNDKNTLILNSSIKLGRKLAENLDTLDTQPLIKKIYLPHKVYLSKEDAGRNIWLNYTSISFGHNYTIEQTQNMLDKAKKYFKKQLSQ